MVWHMEQEHSVILKEVFMKENGSKTSSMEKGLSTGTIIKSSMKEILLRGKKQVKENLNVKVVPIPEIL
jgi:hypothetical protein